MTAEQVVTAVEIEHRVSSADLVSVLAARTPRVGGNDGGWPGLTLYRHTEPMTPVWNEIRSLSLGVVAQGSKAVMVDGERHVYDAFHYLVLGGDPPPWAEIREAGPSAPFLSLVLEIDPAAVRRISAGMVGRGAGGLAPVVSSDGNRCVVSALDPELMAVVLRFLRSLDSESDRRVLAPMCVEELIYRVLCREQFSRLLRLAARQTVQTPILAALAFVRAHYAEPLTVTDLARQVALSPSAFSAQFREATGRSPYQFLKECRLDRARELLVGDGTSVAAVSRRVGYTSASHFIKEFRTRFGVTPKAYADARGPDTDLQRRAD
jgi:AraC-like DNA-binding protein